MRLHSEARGRGTDLLMLHGWGMHSAMWGDTVDRLSERYRVTTVDLPGHGRSGPDCAPATLSRWAAAVAEVAPERAVWLGWSLGGLLAMRAALDFPQRVARLILVAASACFVRRAGWPHAQSAATLQGFAAELREDYRSLLSRFLALQVWGCADARRQARALREALSLRGEPERGALEAGLAMLRESDLREELPEVACPVLLISGQRDTLVPPAAARYMAGMLPDARLEILAGAGHAPFLAQGERFRQLIGEFLDG
ncbi:MAG TPA: pimeloyl-[acyl-carrier protein] methyl ester esterase [Gammaproteobacteria bacterium]|nr:pimeloyl-[acyl-carrier protein] methyl ester esterase [Gammaproteobacteria bacterium]